MKRKKTKKALSGSVLALVLCFVMLIGTTFAWFTSSDSTAVNKIEAGTLKIELLDSDGHSLEGETLNWQKAEGHENDPVLWEPGATYSLQNITVKNNGNLALKYKISITGIKGDAKLNEAITWTIKNGDSDYEASTEVSLAADASQTLTISGTMNTAAGNEYQGLSIDGVAITVYAKQDTVEYDSTTNRYDANATYDVPWDGVTKTAPEKTSDGKYRITNAAELVYAMENSTPNMIGYSSNEYAFGEYVLESNIDLGGNTVAGFADNGSNNFQGSFDGQGFTISNFTIDNSEATYYGGLFGYLYGATVKNLTVSNATVIGQRQVGVLVGAASDSSTVTNCKVYNSTVIAEEKVGTIAGYTLSSTVTDCYAENCDVYCSENDADECGEVIGYANTGTTASGNSSKDVTVHVGATAPTFVSTAEQLASALDNTGNYGDQSARNIVLTADIDATGWTAVNGSTNFPYFTIDGKGHSIKNLSAPLFDNLPARGFTVKNVNFANANISTSDSHYAGVLVGMMNSSGGGTYVIENCNITNSSIKAYKYAGGFIGFAAQPVGGSTGRLTIRNCTVSNTTIETEDSSAGGLIGHTWIDTNLTNCAISGTTSVGCKEDRNGSEAKAGWFVGTVNAGTTTISGCTNSSTGTLGNNNAVAALNNDFVGRSYGTVSVG